MRRAPRLGLALALGAFLSCASGMAGVWGLAGVAQAPTVVPIPPAAPATAGAPSTDVPGRRSADGARIEASAVGLPDWRFPTLDARCRSARAAGLRRGRELLHAYVDRALRGTNVTPPGVGAAHAVVDTETRVIATRSLVECSAIVTVSVGVSSLERAVEGADVPWP